VRKFFLQIFTEPNNKTFCPVRVLALAGGIQYLALSAHHFLRNSVFDPQAFAIGFAALLAGIGVALGTKKDTPEAPSAKP
jgi:hypothetical protein